MLNFGGRAEYAVVKAERLFELLDVPRIINHIERNIESINSVADHVDELYIADLSEKSNDKATILSLGLTAVSFILVLLVLPSFWADLIQVRQALAIANNWLFQLYLYSGSFLGFGLAGLAIILLLRALQREGIGKIVGYFFSKKREV
jgi:hypothetical protein